MKPHLLEQLVNAGRTGRPAALVTRLDDGLQCLVVDGDVHGSLALDDAAHAEVLRRLRAGHSGRWQDRLFVRVYTPPARLVLIGAVHVARALETLARNMDFNVIIVDPRTAFANPERFPRATLVTDWPDAAVNNLALDTASALVTLTHDPRLDDPALLAALNTDAFFIGALGSRRTHVSRLRRLRDAGAGDGMLARIHAPVGIPLGGRRPDEVALSILAQIVQARHLGRAA